MVDVDESGVLWVVVGWGALFPGVGLAYPAVYVYLSEFWWVGFCYEDDEVWDGVLVLADGCCFSCAESSYFDVCSDVGDVPVFVVFGVVPDVA